MFELKQFDASTVAVMRQASNEVVADHRFLMRTTVTLEVAEHILQQAASGECDLTAEKFDTRETEYCYVKIGQGRFFAHIRIHKSRQGFH